MNQITRQCERRSKRVVTTNAVRFQSGSGRVEAGRLTDVNINGFSMTSQSAVRAGQHLMVNVALAQRASELKGRVAWCTPCAEGYRVGVHVYHDTPEAKLTLCGLMCASLKQQAAVSGIRDRNFRYAEWKLAAIIAREADRSSSEIQLVPAIGTGALALGY